MKKINAAKFKEQVLKLIDTLPEEGLVITKHGRPVARVTPMYGPCGGLLGALKGTLKFKGDLTSTGINWNAQS